MRESSEIVFILFSSHPFFTSWRPIYFQNMTQSLQHARKRWTTNCHKGDYNMELMVKRMEELSRRYLPQHDWALAEQDWWETHSNTQFTTTRFTKKVRRSSSKWKMSKNTEFRFSLLSWDRPHLVKILPCRYNVLRWDMCEIYYSFNSIFSSFIWIWIDFYVLKMIVNQNTGVQQRASTASPFSPRIFPVMKNQRCCISVAAMIIHKWCDKRSNCKLELDISLL